MQKIQPFSFSSPCPKRFCNYSGAKPQIGLEPKIITHQRSKFTAKPIRKKTNNSLSNMNFKKNVKKFGDFTTLFCIIRS